MNNLMQYKCNNLGFSTEVSGNEDAGPLAHMNLISSIVVYKGGNPLTSTCG